MKQRLNKSEQVRKEYKIWEFIAKLIPYYTKYKWSSVVVLISLALFTFSGRLLPIIFGRAIDYGVKSEDLNQLYYYAFAYLGFEILKSFFYFVQFYQSQRLSNRVLFDIRKKIVHHVQRLSVQYFDKTPTGKVLTRMTNDVVGLGDFLTQGFTGILVNVVEIISIFLSLIYLSYQLSMITLVAAPLIIWSCIILSKKIRLYSRQAKGKMSNINTLTSESLSGMKIIKLYNHDETTFNKFTSLTKEYFDINFSLIKSFALLWPSVHMFNINITVITLIVGAYFYKSFGLTVGVLGAYILLLQGFFRPLRGILERYSQFQNSLASADRIFDLLAQKQEPYDGKIPDKDKRSGKIIFKNLSFSYEPDLPQVLKNINLTIEDGQSLAIVGRTGSGKSTLISLLQKFYPAADNSIFIDDLCINKMDSTYLRTKVNILQQNNFIFKGSLEDNVSLFSTKISKQKAIQALKTVNCDYLLERQQRSGLAKDFIEENGSNLSLGEKQLVCFARVLAFDPQILILDEATANIDSNSEELIQQATKEIIKNRTSIIIAHRLSTIVNCDKILLLDQGRILEFGSHTELLKKQGSYSKLYQQQIKNSAKLSPAPL